MTDAPWIFHWNVDPVLIHLGPLAIRYYSLGFILGFYIGYAYMKSIFTKKGFSKTALDDLLLYVFWGTIIGARLGHCLFYEPEVYLRDPIAILKVWEGGLASHGGTLGVIIAVYFYCRRYPDITMKFLADELTFPIAITAGFIRLGNLFNSEIIGRPTGADWGVIFDRVDAIPRYPAQLFESIAYFATAFLILIWQKRSAWLNEPLRRNGLMFAMIFTARFFIEFFKEVQVSFEESMPLDMGQLLSIPFITFGVWALFRKIPARPDSK